MSIALLTGASGCSSLAPNEKVASLRDTRLAKYPSLYGYSETPDAAGLLGCFGVGGPVAGIVDTDRRMATFSASVGAPASIVWTSEVVFVRSVLVVEHPETEWLSIQRRDAATPTAIAIADALDASLARVAFAPTLPPAASDVVDAVLSADPTITPTTNASGTPVVRATIDPQAIDDASSSSQPRPGMAWRSTSRSMRQLSQPASQTVTPMAAIDMTSIGKPLDVRCSVGA